MNKIHPRICWGKRQVMIKLKTTSIFPGYKIYCKDDDGCEDAE